MQARVAAGLPASIPGDVIQDPDQKRDYTRLRNGYDRPTGASKDTPEAAGPRRIVSHGNLFRGDRKRLIFQQSEKLPPLGPRLRELRKRRGLSLGQVSQETGLSRNGLSQLESGVRKQPHLCVLWLLADVYRISIDELVGRDQCLPHQKRPGCQAPS